MASTEATARRPALRAELAATAAILSVAAVWAVSRVWEPGPDWTTFYEASHYLADGRSPYLQQAFANPPWALIPALPLALLLPKQLGGSAWLVLSFAAFGLVAYRLGAKPLGFGLFLAAPTTAHCLLNGNIDWLPLLGFTLAPQIGLPIVLIKPQIGLGIAIFWVVEAYREGGIRQVLRIVYPAAALYLVSFVVFGLWMTSYDVVFRNSIEWNASFFPYTIPLGLGLIAMGIYRRRAIWTYGAGPCLSPYVLFHVWNALLVSLLKKPWILAAISAALWIYVFSRI